jgi:hypothetical protein
VKYALQVAAGKLVTVDLIGVTCFDLDTINVPPRRTFQEAVVPVSESMRLDE